MIKRNAVLLIGIFLFSGIFLSCESKDKYPDSIGVWKRDFMNEVIQLKKTQSRYIFIANADYGEREREVIQDTKNTLKFIVPDSRAGDYYIIDNGYLEVWDSEGKIDRYDIIKKPDFK